MKKIITVFLLSLIFTSCAKQFIQVFDTQSVNTKLSNESYIYESDTLKITYSFWAEKGVMAFSVYNKLNRPIYIDWKNSSFIYNDHKLDYWIDEQQTKTAGYYGGYYYKGPLIKPGLAINEGIQSSVAETVKPERITFIPPKSYSSHSQFYLLPVDFLKIDKDKMTKESVSRNDNPNKQTIIYEQKFDVSNTPLSFRNYLAFSFSETSKDFYFVDNGFYLSAVKEMDRNHFHGKITGRDKSGAFIYGPSPFKKMTSFYIKINYINSIDNQQSSFNVRGAH